MLESIKLIISATIMIITALLYVMVLLERKIIKITPHLIITTILGTIIYSIGITYLEGVTKTIFLCCLYFILFKQVFQISYTEALFLTFMYVLLTIIPEIILLFYLIVIAKVPPEICDAQISSSLGATIAVSIIFITITVIFRKLLRKVLKIEINNNKKILLYTILTLGSILVIFYTIVEGILVKENVILSIMIMFVFVTILYSLIRQKMENDKIVEKYDKLLEFIKKYEKIIEQQREARHESKNQLITIKSKIINKEVGEEIIKYVDSLLKDHVSYDEDKYSKFQYLPANGIKGLFYYKSMEAEEKGIILSIEVGEKVEKSILSKLSTEDFKQLGRLVGVYLDNAIEASIGSKEKKMGIEVYVHKKDVIVIISNTYAGEINTESVGKVRYSTKGNNRGYGLMLVNKILSGSNRFEAERQISNNLYVQKIVIKKSI